jgi:CCR4-NOT transcription complex subunit 1
LFALDIAALAANKEYLDFEKWLADAVDVKDEDFLQGVFEFAEYKIGLEMEHQHQSDNVPAPPFPLGQEVYATIIRVVRNARKLEREDIGRFKRLRTDILIIHPRLLNLRPNSKEEQGYSVAKFSKEITAQNDEMYRRMYAEELKLDDVIAELKRYQSSDDPREQELFASALHAVFDEYKFVKAYPAKELTMTGILFGAIIDFRLVKDIPAFVVTRYVLDAIKTPPQEPLYQFGINALSVLRGSLVDFPGLCRSLLEIPALHESHPVLINDIVSALQEREDLDLQGGVKLAFPALKLPILVEEGDDEHREPEPAKKDQFMFIINQIAPSNYQSKAEDLVKVFEDQYSRWFAHYFIDVRVALEANRHDIYMKVLEEVNSPVLERHVLWETLRKARDLLNSEATISSASERTTLKTVAMWLGRLTLARNKPIRMKELSVKDLLIQGYDNKRLIVAIPFVCNLMMACKESSVFHPPNPWMLAVIRLLVEFYHFAELRLNLKFEIEVLLSKLDIKLESIEPSDLLRTHLPPPPPQPELPNRLDLEYQKATSELLNGAQRFEPPVDPAFARMQAFQSEQAAQAAQEAFVRRIDELVAALPEVLVFSGEYPIFTAPTGKRIVHHSIDRAIREIINPVVERSVTIAGISSRDLVQKDFGMEGDAQKMRHSAHLMVQNLAGNLAIVTCKEPLRTAMITNIRSMLGQNGFTEDNMPDAMISGVVNDNIDAGCSVIKKAAMEKAAKDIDVNLAPQYAARRAHREARSQQPFWDGGSFGVAISHSALPDSLRIRSGGLTPSQLRVYEDFGEHTRIQPQSNGDYGGYQQQAQQSQRDELGPGELKRGPSPMYSETPGPNAPSPQVMPAQTSLDKFQELVAELERLIAQTPADSLMALPADHDIRQVIRTVIIIAHSSANREGTTLIISQKVVQLLYKSQSPLGREVYTLTLQNLCELSRKVDKEVKQWLIYAEDSVSTCNSDVLMVTDFGT